MADEQTLRLVGVGVALSSTVQQLLQHQAVLHGSLMQKTLPHHT